MWFPKPVLLQYSSYSLPPPQKKIPNISQPLHLIRTYCGDEVALYFAWFGFLLLTLLPPALIGIACTCFSIWRLVDDRVEDLRDVCRSEEPHLGFYPMCPTCDKDCRLFFVGGRREGNEAERL